MTHCEHGIRRDSGFKCHECLEPQSVGIGLDDPEDIRRELIEARREVEALKVVLRSVQYRGGESVDQCPVCWGLDPVEYPTTIQNVGHRAECEIRLVLR